MRKRIFGASLAVAALAASMTPMTLQTAFAGETSQCYASTFTVTKTDAETGATLQGAQFAVTLPADTYAIAGDQKALSADFKTAFDGAAPDYYATAGGTAWTAAQQSTLGTTFVGYPVDITNLTDPAVQSAAMTNWQADHDGTIETLRADAQRRLDAVNAALTANPTMETIDKATYDAAVAERDKLQTVVDGIADALAATVWADFVTAYNTLSDEANWSYGINHEPSVEYKDSVAGADFSVMNAAGADAVGATSTITVTTGADGTAVFTVFGMKDTYLDAGTRGDLSCSQLTASLQEMVAPDGYLLDEAVKADVLVSSDLASGATAAVTLTNAKWNSPVPEPSIRTSTGK